MKGGHNLAAAAKNGAAFAAAGKGTIMRGRKCRRSVRRKSRARRIGEGECKTFSKWKI